MANLDDLLTTCARVYKIKSLPSQIIDKQDVIVDFMRRYSTLLIVDNLEALDDQQEMNVLRFVRDLLPAPSKAIVTTRKRLSGEGEVSFQLENLDFRSTEQLILSSSRQDKVPKSYLTKIHQVTGGSPLAIKFVLAQANVREKNLDNVLNNLREAKRSNSLIEYCFRETYKDLSQSAKKFFLGMSIINQMPTRLDYVIRTCDLRRDEADEAVVELESLSLISSFGTQRLLMAPLTQTFARLELSKNPQLESVFLKRAQDH
jgi:hypothetical protein